MKVSPLQLERSLLSRIHLDASRETKTAQSVAVTTSTQCARHSENPRRWMVTLRVVLAGKEGDDPAPYTGEIEAVGFFSVEQAWPEGNVGQLVVVNGPAVLYGMVREMVAGLTARGPHKPLTLPTVTFVDQTLKMSEPDSAPAVEAPTVERPKARRTRSARPAKGGSSSVP